MYQKFGKRMVDFVLSLMALIILAPFILIIAIFVKVKIGKPVFFYQDRPGKDEKIFRMYKFRSMTEERDENGELLPDNVRLIKFGRFLRSASLDELPELWNILKGDMSIIGPRPLLAEYLPLYNEEQKHRHDVRPGLTGLAQVKGRNAISWEEKFSYDLEYVKNISLLQDIKIIGMTIGTVFHRKGVNASESVTMEKFRGTKK